MADSTKKDGACRCPRRELHIRQKRKKEQCKRKRQTLVCNQEDEAYEPYMKDLRKEFSDVSILCDSKIELPWKDIALPSAGMKIRQEVSLTLSIGEERNLDGDIEGAPTEKESSGTMPLPWQDLLITQTIQTSQFDACDSSLEIPWDDLALEKPMEIRPTPEEEACASDDVEIPWDQILIPPNIVIESQRKKKHPSTKNPPRTLANVVCAGCKLCCTKLGKRIKPTTPCTM